MNGKRLGAPIGARIRQVCEMLEEHGPINARQLYALDQQMTLNNITKYARRAVVHGFTTIDRSTWPHTYAVLPDWRQTVDERGERSAVPVLRRRVSSVWELGASA
jgi:hypothetical protein